MNREMWRPVVGYENYYNVSDRGRVKRTGKNGGAIVGRILQPWKTSKGYLVVSLYDGHDHKKNKTIHRLVVKAFIGPCSASKKEIRHLDGNPGNNRVGNLLWGNNAENKEDMIRHGRSSRPLNPLKGNDHPGHKIDDQDISRILQLLHTTTQVKIAKIFNVSQSTISAIKNGNIRRSDRKQKDLDYYRQFKKPHIGKSGEQHPMYKLTKDMVLLILELLETKTQKEVAKQLGVSQSLISTVKCGRHWRIKNE